MVSIFADSSVIIAGAGSSTGASRAVLTLAELGFLKVVNTKDFTAEVAATTGLIIQTPGNFIQDIRGIITEGLR